MQLAPQSVCLNASWSHLSDLPLADPEFGRPGKIDLLLGVDIYTDVLLHGRRMGLPGSPAAFETIFGWVLAGRIEPSTPSHHCVASHHVSVLSSDELLSKFWELEETPNSPSGHSHEECLIVQHFQENY